MTTVFELPPPSLAFRLHEAAGVLRAAGVKAREEMARNDYWSGDWPRAVQNAVGDDVGALLGLFSPGSVLELADWLDEVGAHGARHGDGAIARGARCFAVEILDAAGLEVSA